ncbi:MAG: hypothetical protein KFF72_03185 [Arthrospira sp. SH-MAG29]|nr:hypothetical protein [Arthrospira sp. SH-MAG29]MBS0015369.1 hypothetical protein [Arthrospira sp. SH-MAG29]
MNATQSNPIGSFTNFNPTSDGFDFDLWAKAVKQQLVAALQHSAENPNYQLDFYSFDDGEDLGDLDDNESDSE